MVGLTAGAAIWHDVECASYDADLPLWRELAEEAAARSRIGGEEPAGGAGTPAGAGFRPATILDLGCGTGRVALDLASRGHQVTGLDSEPSLTAALAARARERRLRVRAETADARSFDLGGQSFDLAIAPMQVAQLLGGPDGRTRMLESARRHLRRGAVLAIALADPLEGVPDDEDMAPPLPDVREEDGWVYSSTPVDVREEEGATAIDRLRQAVSPSGELDESMATIRLDSVRPEELEAEARPSYSIRARRQVPPTTDYVGSVVVMLEAR